MVKPFNYSPVKLYNNQKSMSIEINLVQIRDTSQFLKTFKEKLRNKHNTRFIVEIIKAVFLAVWVERAV